MDPLIAITDFTNPMLVWAKTDGVTNTYFNNLVERYQKKILEDILGVLLYNDFVTNETTAAFWTKFVGGTSYTEDSIEYVYLGIKPVLVGFIFFYWQAAKKSTLAEDGHTIANYNESIKYIPNELMCESWNDAVNAISNEILYSPTVNHYIDTQYTGNIDWNPIKIKQVNLIV